MARKKHDLTVRETEISSDEPLENGDAEVEHILEERNEESSESTPCVYPECPSGVLTAIYQKTKNIETITRSNHRILVSHTEILSKIADAQTRHMANISDHTKDIARNLQKYGEENEKLVGIIAGKKQVPVSVFILVLCLLGLAFLITIVYVTKTELLLDSNTLKLSPNKIVSTEKEK